MAKASQPVTINSIEFDALIEEIRTFEATVPEYAIESGYSVSDAIILVPEKLEMTLFVTNTPVTWYERHKNTEDRVADVISQLEALYFAKEPVTIVTSEATFSNMAIETMTISKTFDTGYAREIPISFVKVESTKVVTAEIPESYGKGGASNAAAGTANTTTGDTGNSASGDNANGNSGTSGNNGDDSGSILWEAGESLGLF